MSISPTVAQRSFSNNSLRDREQSSNLRHGLLPSQQDCGSFGPRTSMPSSSSTGSAQDSPTGPPSGCPIDIFGANHGTFQDTSGASNNVREFKGSNVRKHSSGPSFSPRGSSQLRSNRLDTQLDVKLDAMPASDHWSLDSCDAQIAAVQVSSRRREVLNANHLLNFHYNSTPRGRQQHEMPPLRRQQKVKAYNKDLFLQANYKFVIYDSGSYSIESIDPDKMFPWEDVVSVIYSTPTSVQCPICLESPLCPQITSCGHIYCFPCILRYLLTGVEEHNCESWKKCPLCFSMISYKDLYTIRIDNVKQFCVGDFADFALLVRAKDSQIPLFKCQNGAGVEPTYFNNTSDLFSKFILSSDVDLSVRDAKACLTDWLYKTETGVVDDLEKHPYVCIALEQLEERMKRWMANRVLNESSHQLNHCALSSSKVMHHPNSLKACSLNSNLDAEHAHSDVWMATISGLIPEKLESSGSSPPFKSAGSSKLLHVEEKVALMDSSTSKDTRERSSYSFYQAIDGQPLILHPLCMKCLLHHFRSYDMLPLRISGKILELETITQSEAMRKRYRYLSHFSLTTSFQLCEIELTEILPTASLAPFIDEIRKREKHRKHLAKKERAQKARAEAESCAEAASLREMLNPTNQRYLGDKDTIFSLDAFEALGSGIMPTTNSSMSNTRKLFSNVTRLGFAAAHDSPNLGPEESVKLSVSIDATHKASGSQGQTTAATPSFANILLATKREVQSSNGTSRKGKKPNRVLLSTAGGRRY